MSSAQPKYTVVREFKYEGKIYKKGDTWIPAGQPNDEWLSSNMKYVVLKKTKAQQEAERAEYVKHQQDKYDKMTGKKTEAPVEEQEKPKPKKRKARKKKK